MDRKWETVIRDELPKALDNQQMAVVFQPLRDINTQLLVGFEALLRWNHPTGLVPRKGFIFQAERNGEIKRLGEWVLNRSLDQIVEWRHLRPDLDINVHVNVGHIQLLDTDYPGLASSALRVRSLETSQLVLELTSDYSLVDTATLPALTRLKRNGICIAADDVGSADFQIDTMKSPQFQSLIGEVKLDKSVVWGGELDEIYEIVNNAHAMGAKVVAEGIEHDHQYIALAELGADIVQGYHPVLGRPMVAEEATRVVIAEPTSERLVDRARDYGAEL